jgi:hypothetical protein
LKKAASAKNQGKVESPETPQDQGKYVLLTSQEKHAEFLVKEISSGQITKLQIASFNLWAGILHDGREWPPLRDNPASNIFDACEAHKVETEVVIGIPPFYSRAGATQAPCLFCANHHRRLFLRLKACRKRWPKIAWFYHPHSHTKLSLGWNKDQVLWAVTGGHNLGDSKMVDFSILLDQHAAKLLVPVFEQVKESADPDLSDIRVEFEDNVRDAQPPKGEFPEQGPPGTGEEGDPQKARTYPSRERPLPPAEELSAFLMALARSQYLSKEDFTAYSRSSAWLIDQIKGDLTPQGHEAFGNHPQVKVSLQRYRAFKGWKE